MSRLGGLVIAVCIVLIAASLILILYLQAGLTLLEASLAGVLAGLAMAAGQARAVRLRERKRLYDEIEAAHYANRRLQHDLGQMRDEVAALTDFAARLSGQEDRINQRIDERVDDRLAGEVDQRIKAEIGKTKSAMVGEMQALHSLIKQLADRALLPARAPAAAPGAQNHSPRAGEDDDLRDEAEELDAELLRMTRHALAANRVDVYLQPIVTLPQRKVRYYEALVRLRGDHGEPIFPEEYLRVGEPAGLLPILDNIVLLRAVQIVRQMTRRNNSFSLFCNISLQTLGDPEQFPQFIDFLEHNPELAKHLVFEFGQAALLRAGPLELESLGALQELGYRFSLDHVEQLDMDPQRLARRGFRFVKVNAALLLDNGPGSKTHIHPADIGALLARHGLELIGEKIETESDVVNLLDFDLALGQGYLFAEPRPLPQASLREANDPRPARKVG